VTVEPADQPLRRPLTMAAMTQRSWNMIVLPATNETFADVMD